MLALLHVNSELCSPPAALQPKKTTGQEHTFPWHPRDAPPFQWKPLQGKQNLLAASKALLWSLPFTTRVGNRQTGSGAEPDCMMSWHTAKAKPFPGYLPHQLSSHSNNPSHSSHAEKRHFSRSALYWVRQIPAHLSKHSSPSLCDAMKMFCIPVTAGSVLLIACSQGLLCKQRAAKTAHEFLLLQSSPQSPLQHEVEATASNITLFVTDQQLWFPSYQNEVVI